MIQNGEEFSMRLGKILPPVMPALNASVNHEIPVFCPLKAHSGVAAMECSCGHFRDQTIVQHLVGSDDKMGRNSLLLGPYLLSSPSGGISRPAFTHHAHTMYGLEWGLGMTKSGEGMTVQRAVTFYKTSNRKSGWKAVCQKQAKTDQPVIFCRWHCPGKGAVAFLI